MDIPRWQPFLQTLRGQDNLWYHTGTVQVFKVGTTLLDFTGWLAMAGQEVGSHFTAPPAFDTLRSNGGH
ncbi:MAG: hypothetical protein FJZ47_17940 [Candidatus Tectomicrobia bacterium]|uniref:Uncharacterized protein n=1 Tax=Tectimicrobiota bacterium TaxID=2528274 RepID=A0A937W2F0_UNCTE|nr:hypothetical protein [Candidatus Tectomicrobia bacterium]